MTAPRVTTEAIKANIASEHYKYAICCGEGAQAYQFSNNPPLKASPSLGMLTFCVLVLKNGFTVTGESACVSPENFDAEMGRKIARENAERKIWPLMGYAFKPGM